MLALDRHINGVDNDAKKLAGCMAASLECNLWLRARTADKLSHQLCGKGITAFSKSELLLPAGTARDVPSYFKTRPILRFLGKKIAHFLHDYHSSSFPYLGFEESNGEHNQLTPQQLQNLVGRTQTYVSGGGPRRCPGELKIHSLLRIGHTDFGGEQFVRSSLPHSKLDACSRSDFVFFIPPPPFNTKSRCDFSAGLESCWYRRVVLLFSMKVDCDEDQPLNCPCAMIEVMYDYSTPDWGRQAGQEGTKMVYLPAPDDWHTINSERGVPGGGRTAPVVYIVPVDAILGRLALVPAGTHGTIPATMSERRQAVFPMGVCDRKNEPGAGSRLFYINSWAMQWPSDHPIRSAADWAAECS